MNYPLVLTLISEDTHGQTELPVENTDVFSVLQEGASLWLHVQTEYQSVSAILDTHMTYIQDVLKIKTRLNEIKNGDADRTIRIDHYGSCSFWSIGISIALSEAHHSGLDVPESGLEAVLGIIREVGHSAHRFNGGNRKEAS